MTLAAVFPPFRAPAARETVKSDPDPRRNSIAGETST
jgi:hypothetical protein